ncbi:MAG: hypothetical protein ABFC31_13515 [Clostridiaceae bacterium]
MKHSLKKAAVHGYYYAQNTNDNKIFGGFLMIKNWFQFSAASIIGSAQLNNGGRTAVQFPRKTAFPRDKYHFATVESLEDSMYPDFYKSALFPSLEAMNNLGQNGFGTTCRPGQSVCYDRYGVPHSAPAQEFPDERKPDFLAFQYGTKQCR